MKKLGTAEGLAHFHRQGLLNQAERDRLTRAAATGATTQPRFSVGRIFAAFTQLLTGLRASTSSTTVPPQSA